jgi:hypothetical protein
MSGKSRPFIVFYEATLGGQVEEKASHDLKDKELRGRFQF